MDKISLTTYGLSREELDRDLSEFYEKVNNHKAAKSIIEKKYQSVEDYIDILYILKFVRKYSNSEMGEITGKRNFSNVYMQSGLHWEYRTNDFVECQRLYQEELYRVKKWQQEAHYEVNNELYSSESFIGFSSKVSNKTPRSFLAHCNYTLSKEDFIKELYYLWEIKKASIREIAVLYDRTLSAINHYFQNANISISQSEAQQRASDCGRRDYARALQEGRKTTIRAIANNGLLGSKAENTLRTLIESTINQHIDSEKYEIVIGVNSRNIINPLEVDIPIVIIKKHSNCIYKFAIEVDGLFWHENMPADKKASALKNQDWLYIPITYDQELVNNSQKLADVAEDICKKLNQYIC